MGRENGFQSWVLNYLNSIPGCQAENVSGDATQSGRPDILGCFRGRMFKIELKQPDNEYQASIKQILELRRWSNAGCVIGVAYSRDFIRWLFSQPWEDKNFTGGEENTAPGCVSWARVPKW